MNTKKFLSLALLASAFSVAPVFAMEDAKPENPEQKQPEQKPADKPAEKPEQKPEQKPEAKPEQKANDKKADGEKAGWTDTVKAPFSFAYDETSGFLNNTRNMIWPEENVTRAETFKKLKKFWYGIGAAVVARYVYDNLDDIKAFFGSAEEENANEGQEFASVESDLEKKQVEEEACEAEKVA